MKMMRLKQFASTIALTLLLTATGTALAQQGAAGQGAGQGMGQGSGGDPGAGYQAPPSAPMDVDDETVSNFADAFLSVQELSEDLTDKLSEAPDAEAAQSMQREAQDEMAQSVEESGLSVEQYNEIAIGMRQDPKLAERVKAAVDQAR